MAVNGFSVMSLGKVNLMNPSKVSYKDAVDILQDEFHRQRKSFVKVGFYLKHIRDNELFLEDGYQNINEFAFNIFNLSQSSTSRYINICEQFSVDGNSPELDERFMEYNISQLIEMVSIAPEKIEQLSPQMSVKEIKEFKKPDEVAIRNFYSYLIAKTVYADNREELKDYLISNFGETSFARSLPGLTYACSRKGISLNGSAEITWVTLVKEINRLIPISQCSSEEDNDIPGQTSIEKDFPEYMPEDSYATSHKTSEKKTTCPEGISSCTRNEWGCGDEEQKAGQKECDQCWEHHNKLFKDTSTLDKEEDNEDENQIIDGKFREIPIEQNERDAEESNAEVQHINSIPLLENKKEEKMEFPILKNADQRKEWLRNYKDWGLWYRDENIDVNYYKFDFPDGNRLICCEYPARDHEWVYETRDEIHYHLLEKNKPKYDSKKTYDEKFCHSTTSETYLIEFLKRFK
ncbi:MAG: hypothetical protein ACI4DN_09195 [Lachnospiraceae bacterium]